MKLIVRGERRTGKTALCQRLQALPFSEEYKPTPEIATANINWRYKGGDEAVKVEVWDVVDNATAKPGTTRVDADAPAGVVSGGRRGSGWEATLNSRGSVAVGA